MSVAVTRLLCVHQGCELYGSDRTFVQSVRALRHRFPHSELDVVLPAEPGPLAEALRSVADRVEHDELMVIRRRRLRPSLLGRLPEGSRRIEQARRRIEAHDLTYVNTVVIADYLLAARTASRPVVVHVHELPVGPERVFFSRLLRWARPALVFNSWATRSAFSIPRRLPAWVVHNGAADPVGPVAPPQPDAGRAVRLALLGRYGSWKGQELLIDALARLPSRLRESVRVRMAGSGFDRPEAGRRLRRRAVRRGVGPLVEIEPFQVDPSPLYRWADLIVVPSMRPEPFGLTAIEAMAHARPVVAAAHGGLAEIVVDGQSGTLFTPRSAASLARALGRYLDDRSRITRHGAVARRRFERRFHERLYLDSIGRVASIVLGRDEEPGDAQTVAAEA